MKKKLFMVFGGILGLVLIGYALDESSLLKTFSQNKENKPDSTVRLGLYNTPCKPDNLPYIVAKDKGYFEGVNISETYSNYQRKQEFLDENLEKNFDLLVAGRAEVYYLEATLPNKWDVFTAVVDTEDQSSYAILTKKGFEGSGLNSLKGKSIGLMGSSGKARFVLMNLILEKQGLNPKDFTIKDASVEDFESDRVDALYIREPQLAVALSQDKYKIIADNPVTKNIMSPWPMGFSAVSSKFSKKNPEETSKIINAWYKGVDFIKNNPEETKKYQTNCLESNYQVKGQTVRPAEFWKTNDFDKSVIQKQIDLYLEKGLIPQRIKVEDIIY